MDKINIRNKKIELIQYINQLEKENKELKIFFKKTTKSLINYGEISRAILHSDQIINNAGGWDFIDKDNGKELCAIIQNAAMRVKK